MEGGRTCFVGLCDRGTSIHRHAVPFSCKRGATHKDRRHQTLSRPNLWVANHLQPQRFVAPGSVRTRHANIYVHDGSWLH